MHIAIFGANSHLAKDLTFSFKKNEKVKFTLFSRSSDLLSHWVNSKGLSDRALVKEYDFFKNDQSYDVILNFIGIGNPKAAFFMGSSIFEITLHYDAIILDYLKSHSECRYIFISSGAVYGCVFEQPVDVSTEAKFPVNRLGREHWYGLAKLYAESVHRAMSTHSIIDVRVFNYFSHTQDMSSSFFISDMVRAIVNKTIFKTSTEQMMRDYLHPDDFSQLIQKIIIAQSSNLGLDCYSLQPIDKVSLLVKMKERYGLNYEFDADTEVFQATGHKVNYYSVSKVASQFGYEPKYNSLDTIVSQIDAYLGMRKIL